MQNAEFLRALIDYIDSIRDSVMAVAPVVEPEEVEDDEETPNITINVVAPDETGVADNDDAVDPREVDSPVDDDETFVPPLQAHLEIMKKMAGIEAKNQDLISPTDPTNPFAG